MREIKEELPPTACMWAIAGEVVYQMVFASKNLCAKRARRCT
jgi:hypothetical protein